VSSPLTGAGNGTGNTMLLLLLLVLPPPTPPSATFQFAVAVIVMHALRTGALFCVTFDRQTDRCVLIRDPVLSVDT
jgi:hypothetical protein